MDSVEIKRVDDFTFVITQEIMYCGMLTKKSKLIRSFDSPALAEELRKIMEDLASPRFCD